MTFEPGDFVEVIAGRPEFIGLTGTVLEVSRWGEFDIYVLLDDENMQDIEEGAQYFSQDELRLVLTDTHR